jgi:hypothetical protein
LNVERVLDSLNLDQIRAELAEHYHLEGPGRKPINPLSMLKAQLAKHPLTVPMLIVGGLFDQEDIYGSPALYKALAPKDPDGKARATSPSKNHANYQILKNFSLIMGSVANYDIEMMKIEHYLLESSKKADIKKSKCARANLLESR